MSRHKYIDNTRTLTDDDLWTDEEYERFREMDKKHKIHKINWKKYDPLLIRKSAPDKELRHIIGCGLEMLGIRRKQLRNKAYVFATWSERIKYKHIREKPVTKRSKAERVVAIPKDIDRLITQYKQAPHISSSLDPESTSTPNAHPVREERKP